MINAFGIDHDPIVKADRRKSLNKALTGTQGDKRNTKYALSGYGGAVLGAHAGQQIGTRTAGTTPGKVNRGLAEHLGREEGWEHFNRMAGAGGGSDWSAGSARKVFGAMGRDVGAAYRAVPGAVRGLKGSGIGAGVGLATGAGAYALHRRKKAASSAFGVDRGAGA